MEAIFIFQGHNRKHLNFNFELYNNKRQMTNKFNSSNTFSFIFWLNNKINDKLWKKITNKGH